MNETTNIKHWKKLAGRSLRGGVIDLDHIIVCKKNGQTIIKAGAVRFLKYLGVLFVIASLIIGLMLFFSTKQEPDDKGWDVDCYILLFMLALVFVTEFFLFFRSGMIVLDKETGLIRVRHGMFFRGAREVIMTRESLKVRLYQNRQGGRDRDIGWGHLVLSLQRVDDDGEELILCRSRTAKGKIKKPFEILHEYLGRGEMVGIDDFIEEETSKQPCTAEPEFHVLAKQSRTKLPLLGQVKPSVKKTEVNCVSAGHRSQCYLGLEVF